MKLLRTLVLILVGGCSSAGGGSKDVSTYVKAGTAQGACLVEYNTAVIPQGTDPCCRTNGGADNCDTSVRCNDISGPDCCLFYSTDNDTFPRQCCWYEIGWPHDSSDGSPEATACLALVGNR
jgi:hypothetical protein